MFFYKLLSFPHGYLITKVRTGTIFNHASELRLRIFCLFFFSFFNVLSANFPTLTQRKLNTAIIREIDSHGKVLKEIAIVKYLSKGMCKRMESRSMVSYTCGPKA